MADGQINFDDINYEQELRVWNFKRLLAEKYDVVVTNPPYMGGKGQSGVIAEFLKTNYPDTKSDTFSAFIERCGQMTKRNGYVGMFTPYVWMFIQSYEKLRQMTCGIRDIVTLIQFEYSAFEEATVPVCTFVLRSQKTGASGEYLRLVDFRGGMEVQRIKTLEAIANPNCGYRYTAVTDNFAKIPGMPISYWASENLILAFENGTRMDKIVNPKQGLATADNDRFLRYWWEVDINNVKFDASSRDDALESGKKWFPYNKGGSYRRWYGNYDYVVNWENDGNEIRNFVDDKGKQRSVIRNPSFYFQEAITWSKVSSGIVSFRYKEMGNIFADAGMSIFSKEMETLVSLVGLLNSKVISSILDMLSPTLNYEVGHISSLPVIENNSHVEIVERNIKLSQSDWDSLETSWYFKKHPLV